MEEPLKVTAYYVATSNKDKNQVRGYVDAANAAGLRRLLKEQRFLDVYDDDAKIKAWVNLDQVVEIRPVDPDEKGPNIRSM